ncbi:MAG TPA: hypothetical protein VK625_03210, partial [Flavitalea sp.]|nr:hypothetical protein [Flavitalea sp.]
FGAVDWLCDVYVNEKKVGTHQGGYDPFSFDISAALTKSGAQKIAVRVWDPSDEGPQPRGKQVNRPHGIWYTPVTGIWQTVWVESVPKTYIVNTVQTPDVDKKSLQVSAKIEGAQAGDLVLVSAWKGTEKLAEQSVAAGQDVDLAITMQNCGHLRSLIYMTLRSQ